MQFKKFTKITAYTVAFMPPYCTHRDEGNTDNTEYMNKGDNCYISK